MVAKNGRMVGPIEAVTAEALGCSEALTWIQQHGLVNVIVESDTHIVVLLIKISITLNSCKTREKSKFLEK